MQTIIPADEWDAFEKCMRTPLPTSFRVALVAEKRPRLLRELRTTLQFDPVEIDGEVVHPPKYNSPPACPHAALRRSRHYLARPANIVPHSHPASLPPSPPPPRCRPLVWYPDQSAWRILCHKKVLRKNPKLRAVQKWLVQHTDSGDVWRQESVSMIPALMLDVQSHHVVRRLPCHAR